MPPTGPSESSSSIVLKSLARNQIVPEGRVCGATVIDLSGRPAALRRALRSRWCSGTRCAHPDVVSVLTSGEIVIAARRLAAARPHVVAVAGIVHPGDLWQLCRAELTGVDVRGDGWDIRGRWFGVVVGATPRTGELSRGEVIPWRVIAAQITPRERHAR